MSEKSNISWTDATWSPVTGCDPISPGCKHCYAKREVEQRWSKNPKSVFFGRAFNDVQCHDSALSQPLSWKKPRKIFVCPRADLFHDDVPDSFIDRVFAVMALAPQHTFQVLTKRPDRMREYCTDPRTPGRIARSADCLVVEQDIARMGPERIVPVDGYPGYFISDHGHVYTDQGSEACLRCGKPMPEGTAKRKYCGTKCRQLDAYHRGAGNIQPHKGIRRRMTPMLGEEGHSRVMLYSDGKTIRELVHRLVLTAFVRAPQGLEQGCHRNGDPTINALPNLRWGSQSDNWNDRRRHGNGSPSDFQWPLPNVWKGTSIENQEAADERIQLLLDTPAAVRWISAEPLLGPVNLRLMEYADSKERIGTGTVLTTIRRALDWVVVGGESGPKARPMSPDWARGLRKQCADSGVPFYFKQWGEWIPMLGQREGVPVKQKIETTDGWVMGWAGTKAAGRLLDGVLHDDYPEVSE